MKFEHVATFLEIASCGNFNRAAENLHVTQSTASARIKALEEQFGRPLFTRSHAGVELTAAGHYFYRYASGIQRLWLQAQQDVTLPRGADTMLALGAQVSLWERLILKWMPRMRAKAPQVALRVEADYSISLMRYLIDGLLEIGVMYSPRQAPGLVTEDLFEETLMLVSTRERNVSEGWVEDYIYVDWGDTFRAQHGEAFSEAETAMVSVGHGWLGLQYILDNGGSGYFPMRMVEPMLEDGRLMPVDDAPTVPRPVYMVYTSAPKDDAIMQVALDEMRQVAQEA
ncbi:MAG: Hca operon transcriptional activator HcaR [Gammaproteobacteria bacterium]|nr:Hca operon transcriptional activator HcaR [Gammaproteobacteria bacterium]